MKMGMGEGGPTGHIGTIHLWKAIMVKEGKLNIGAPVDIEEWRHDERRNITVHHLI